MANEEMPDEVVATPNTPAERLALANKTVRNYSIAAMAPALVPVPFLDLALVTSVQLKMLHSLSNIYGVKFSKNLGKEAITSLMGGIAPLAIQPAAASLVKIIPIVGQAAGTLSMVTLSGASTYAVGKVFIQHFESGGTFLTFDPEKVRNYFATELEEGKKVVSDSKSEAASS